MLLVLDEAPHRCWPYLTGRVGRASDTPVVGQTDRQNEVNPTPNRGKPRTRVERNAAPQRR
jgi:hypothetical protein